MISNETVFYSVHLLLLLLVLAGCGGNTSHSPANNANSTFSSSPTANQTSSDEQSSNGEQLRSAIRYGSIDSKALNINIGFSVYLPAGYNANQRYPVLYIMYGYGGNQYSMFNGFMSVNRTADQMIAKGSMRPMILVVPDYKNSFAVPPVNKTPTPAAAP
jgi:enterochelin esterase-like enzyme